MTPSKLGGGDVEHLVFLTSQVPKDLKDRLRALADENERNLSAQLRVAIREHLERHERKAA